MLPALSRFDPARLLSGGEIAHGRFAPLSLSAHFCCATADELTRRRLARCVSDRQPRTQLFTAAQDLFSLSLCFEGGADALGLKRPQRLVPTKIRDDVAEMLSESQRTFRSSSNRLGLGVVAHASIGGLAQRNAPGNALTP
jgi:hypothetical protein